MKKIFYFVLIICSFGCSKEKKKVEFDAWNQFIKVISKKDKEEFKNICSKTINCYLCKDYNSKPITIKEFIEKDFDIIFNDEFIKYLKNVNIDTYYQNIDGKDYCEVTFLPKNYSKYEEYQYHFRFILVNKNWELFDIGTIP